MTPPVAFVGAGPGDPELLTQRAVDRLKRAEVVLFDDLGGSAVLGLAHRDAELIAVGKRAGRPSPRQDHVSRLLVAHATAGRRVVRLKSGDPAVFGRLEEETTALRAAGVKKSDSGLKSAYKWITYQRNQDGGYNPDGENRETQADTTSYAIRAADALGKTGGLTKKSKTALRALQQRNGAIRSTPNVQGDYMGISTANGVLALSGQHYPVVVRSKRSTCSV